MLCNPFNADFDGDSFYGEINATNSQGQTRKVNILDFAKEYNLSIVDSKIKSGGTIVERYKPSESIFIEAIDPNTGNVDNKKILEFSLHKNIEMYNIKDSMDRFEQFKVSYDHSLIVFDEQDGKIKKVSPKELLESPIGKYLIQKENSNGKNVSGN
jgi:hypothetical protein